MFHNTFTIVEVKTKYKLIERKRICFSQFKAA
jgi:hypothetical protein